MSFAASFHTTTNDDPTTTPHKLLHITSQSIELHSIIFYMRSHHMRFLTTRDIDRTLHVEVLMGEISEVVNITWQASQPEVREDGPSHTFHLPLPPSIQKLLFSAAKCWPPSRTWAHCTERPRATTASLPCSRSQDGVPKGERGTAP